MQQRQYFIKLKLWWSTLFWYYGPKTLKVLCNLIENYTKHV